jgi:hypothetical protein
LYFRGGWRDRSRSRRRFNREERLEGRVASGSTTAGLLECFHIAADQDLRAAASTLLSSMATMPVRKPWQVVSGEKLAR